MKELATGIFTKFNAAPKSTLFTALGGRLYDTQAEPGAPYPYMVYQFIDSTPDWTFNTDYEFTRVQFKIVSDKSSGGECRDILGYLKSALDWTTLSVTGWTLVYCARVNVAGPYKDIDGIWNCDVDYMIFLESNTTR